MVEGECHHTRFKRPWAGGIDAPHTYCYHERYGTRPLTDLRRSSHAGTRLPVLSARARALLADDAAERLRMIAIEPSLIRQVLGEPAVLAGAGR